jgi:hypothetical protein
MYFKETFNFTKKNKKNEGVTSRARQQEKRKREPIAVEVFTKIKSLSNENRLFLFMKHRLLQILLQAHLDGDTRLILPLEFSRGLWN